MKRIYGIFSIVLILTFVLAACGAQPTATPAPKPTEKPAAPAATQAPAAPAATQAPAAAAPKGAVTLWHAYQTGSSEEATLATLIKNAQTAFPNVKIDVLQIPFDQIFNKYQTEVAAGGGPDMFVAPNDDLYTWVTAKVVLDITDKLAGKLDKVSQSGVDGMKVGGKLYGVPESAKAVGLYYNKSLLANPPKTMDELLKSVKDGNKLTLFLGAYHLYGLTGAFGGKLFDAGGACIADQGGWAEAMQLVVDLKAAGATVESDYGKAETPFRTGKAAMFINGPWALGDYKKDLGDKLGVVPIPAGPKGKANPLNGIDGFYVNPNSKNVQSAIDLALFLTNKDSSAIYTEKAGHVAIRSDVTAADPLLVAFAQASADGYPRPQSAEFANFWGPFGDAWTKVIEGAQKPAEGVKAACDAMNKANKKTPSAAAPAAPAAAVTMPKGKVTLWHAYQTGSSEEATLQELAKKVTAAAPELKLDILQIPFDQIFNKYQTEVAAGGGPDMFVAPNDDLYTWVTANVVLDITKYLDGKLDKVSQSGVDGMKVGGKLYGVPESAKAVGLYYNKSLLANPPKTMDELLKSVKDGNKLTLFLGAYHLYGLTGAFGGKLFDAGGKCIADQGGWAEAMQLVVDLKAAGATVESDYGKAETPFRTGKAAMFINGPWALGDYKKDLGDKLGVVPIPAGPKGKANPLNGIDGFYVNPNSKNVQGAVDLALYLTGKESSEVYTAKAGHVAIRSDVTAADPLLVAFAQASADGYPRPQSAEFANFWGPFGDAWTKVIEGAQKPAEGVKAACDAMNKANKK